MVDPNEASTPEANVVVAPAESSPWMDRVHYEMAHGRTWRWTCFVSVLIAFPLGLTSLVFHMTRENTSTWDKQRCKLLNTFAEENTCSTRPNWTCQFRSRFVVLLNETRFDAYYGPDDLYGLSTEADALAQISEIDSQRDENHTITCLVSVRGTTTRIAMKEGAYSHENDFIIELCGFICIVVILFPILFLLTKTLRRSVVPARTTGKTSRITGEEIITALRQFTVPSGERDPQVECSVCLETLGSGEDVCRIPCQHEFHLRCLEEWIEKGRGRRCPLCQLRLRSLVSKKQEKSGQASAEEEAINNEQQIEGIDDLERGTIPDLEQQR